MRENQKILFRGEGDQQPDVEPGDVVIILQQKPHEKFQRSGDDLYINHTITLTEALCGFSFMMRHLDGRELLVTHPPGQVKTKNDSWHNGNCEILPGNKAVAIRGEENS